MARKTILAFPFEILSYILSFLNQDTLKRSSLVCSHFRPTSQEHLFHRLTLDDTRDNLACQSSLRTPTSQFALMISESPYIATYVRELELGSQVLDDPMLPTVLQQFTYVTSLSFFTSGSPFLSGGIIKWTHFSLSLRQALQLCIFPSIVTLELEALDIPLCFLGFCRSLKSIVAFNSQFLYEHDQGAEDSAIAPPPPLDSLILMLGPVQQQLVPLTDFVVRHRRNITSLNIEFLPGFCRNEIPAISEFFMACRSSLETLTIVTINDLPGRPSSIGIFRSFFNLSDYPKLRALTLVLNSSAIHHSRHAAFFDELDWIALSIDTTARPTALKEIHIEVLIESNTPPRFTIDGNQLDCALTTPTKIPLLEQIVVSWVAPRPYSHFEDVVQIFRRALPKSFAKGLLLFNLVSKYDGSPWA